MAPAGAERRAHGQLARPSRGAGQDQVGDIGAGDQQDERDRTHHDEERRAHPTDEVVAQRGGHERLPLVGVGEGPSKLGGQ